MCWPGTGQRPSQHPFPSSRNSTKSCSVGPPAIRPYGYMVLNPPICWFQFYGHSGFRDGAWSYAESPDVCWTIRTVCYPLWMRLVGYELEQLVSNTSTTKQSLFILFYFSRIKAMQERGAKMVKDSSDFDQPHSPARTMPTLLLWEWTHFLLSLYDLRVAFAFQLNKALFNISIKMK